MLRLELLTGVYYFIFRREKYRLDGEAPLAEVPLIGFGEIFLLILTKQFKFKLHQSEWQDQVGIRGPRQLTSGASDAGSASMEVGGQISGESAHLTSKPYVEIAFHKASRALAR